MEIIIIMAAEIVLVMAAGNYDYDVGGNNTYDGASVIKMKWFCRRKAIYLLFRASHFPIICIILLFI